MLVRFGTSTCQWTATGSSSFTKNNTNKLFEVTLSNTTGCAGLSVQATLSNTTGCFSKLMLSSGGTHTNPAVDATAPYRFYVNIPNSANKTNTITFQVKNGALDVGTPITITGTTVNSGGCSY
jgi:hypothetical protein